MASGPLVPNQTKSSEPQILEGDTHSHAAHFESMLCSYKICSFEVYKNNDQRQCPIPAFFALSNFSHAFKLIVYLSHSTLLPKKKKKL